MYPDNRNPYPLNQNQNPQYRNAYPPNQNQNPQYGNPYPPNYNQRPADNRKEGREKVSQLHPWCWG